MGVCVCVFSGQEASGVVPLPAAQRAEQRRGVLRDGRPACQMPSSVSGRVSSVDPCDTYLIAAAVTISICCIFIQGGFTHFSAEYLFDYVDYVCFFVTLPLTSH